MSNETSTDDEPRKPSNRRNITVAAVAGTAVLAGLTGAVIGSSVSGDSSNEAQGSDGTSARSASIDVEYGERRGLEDIRVDEPLVDVEWLVDNLDRLDDENIVLIEVSENRPNSGLTPYEEGHIPGAVELVWYDDFVEQENRDLVSQDAFTELAQSAGVNDDSTIVLYGDSNNWFAAYGAWVFNLYGAEDVRLLDGGRSKWEADGLELSNVAPTPASGNFEALTPNRDLRAFQSDVLEVALSATAADAPYGLIDIRGPAEFNGEVGVAEGFEGEAASKWGHVPNAVNVPWASIVNDDGTYKSEDEIREVYAAVGIDGSKPVITYCRIGERASHTWFALTQILGYDVQVYDGSWTEWGNSVGVPVVNLTLGEGERSGLWSGNE